MAKRITKKKAAMAVEETTAVAVETVVAAEVAEPVVVELSTGNMAPIEEIVGEEEVRYFPIDYAEIIAEKDAEIAELKALVLKKEKDGEIASEASVKAAIKPLNSKITSLKDKLSNAEGEIAMLKDDHKKDSASLDEYHRNLCKCKADLSAAESTVKKQVDLITRIYARGWFARLRNVKVK